MATFRLLADHFINGAVLLAGSIQTTGDLLPVNWRPSNNSEPLDGSALTLFYNAGPQLPSLVRAQWSTIGVAPPVTYWKPIPAAGLPFYGLTGLGSGLAPISN